MATALTLIGIMLLVCTLCSTLVLFLSNAEDPDTRYSWESTSAASWTPSVPILRVVPGSNVETIHTPLPQHITLETEVESSGLELTA